MKDIFIEDYKGQSIYYSENYDKFVCEITSNDNFRSTKRNKLDDVRKEIDKFIRDNADFKPFKAIKDEWGTIKLIEFEKLRSDNKLMAKGSVYDMVELSKLKAYDADLMEEIKENRRIFEEASEAYDKKLKELKSKLKPFNTKPYEGIVL